MQYWRTIIDLAKVDFKKKYMGSMLGILWAFIQPTITVLIFWFVFQVGFKAMPVDNFPFILWLIAGMVPWFFYSEALSLATGSIVESSYLVKKMVFKVTLLPIIKIMSAFFVHLFFIAVMFILFLSYGYVIDLYSIQIVYYTFALLTLLFAQSLITSSLLVFLKDVGQFVGMALQFGFWLTPIFWSLKMIPEQYHIILKLNPLYYIVEGYRNSMIFDRWFWEFPYLTAYYWSFTGIALVIGLILFHRLRPHFSDVL